jgi:hypothetical protein
VAREARQTRQHVRINFAAPVRVALGDGRIVPGQTIDVSSGGLAMELLEGMHANHGDSLTVIFPLRTGDAEPPGKGRGPRQQRPAPPVRSAHRRRRRNAHHGALLARRFLARMGRIPRSRSPPAQSGPHYSHRFPRPRNGHCRHGAAPQTKARQASARRRGEPDASSCARTRRLVRDRQSANQQPSSADSATRNRRAGTNPARRDHPSADGSRSNGSKRRDKPDTPPPRRRPPEPSAPEQTSSTSAPRTPSISTAPTATTPSTSQSRKTKW